MKRSGVKTYDIYIYMHYNVVKQNFSKVKTDA